MQNENKDRSRGILYVATGKKYINMAIRSAQSVRQYCPGLNIHLFADWQETGFDLESTTYPFTSVGTVENAHSRSKVDYMSLSPFDKTIYMDTDTRVKEDITDLFQLLDRFDIALAHAHLRVSRLQRWKNQIPDCFPQFNSGVIVYSQKEMVIGLLDQWKEAYHQAGFKSDQITLRECLWLSELRIATLPPEYNLRFMKYLILWGNGEARPKILHLLLYQKGLLWFIHPWIKALKSFYRKLTKPSDGFR
jgi:hypothetical protein